jgi:hypothetical protein
MVMAAGAVDIVHKHHSMQAQGNTISSELVGGVIAVKALVCFLSTDLVIANLLQMHA